MGEHDALGRSGCAGRIDKGGQFGVLSGVRIALWDSVAHSEAADHRVRNDSSVCLLGMFPSVGECAKTKIARFG